MLAAGFEISRAPEHKEDVEFRILLSFNLKGVIEAECALGSRIGILLCFVFLCLPSALFFVVISLFFVFVFFILVTFVPVVFVVLVISVFVAPIELAFVSFVVCIGGRSVKRDGGGEENLREGKGQS